MASKRYLVDIDLNKNQLTNAVIQNLATPPSTPKEGQIYYNTATKKMMGYLGNAWVDLSNIYNHPNYTALNPTLTGNNVLASLETNDEGHITSASTRVLTLADLGYVGDTDANKYIHPTFTGNDLGAPLTLAKVISDVNVDSEGHVTGFETRDLLASDIGAAVINDSLTNAVNTWSSQKIQSEIDTINNSLTGALIYQSGYNAQTNTPDLTSGTGIKQGYTYTVTHEGIFHGEAVQIGDMLIAEADTPTSILGWTVVNKNIPDIVDATSVDKGIIRIATQSEVNAGSSDNLAVTPATLVTFVNAQLVDEKAVVEITGTGTSSGGSSAYNITHNMNTQDLLVQVYDNSTYEDVGVSILRPDVNTVRIITNNDLGATTLRVNIRK